VRPWTAIAALGVATLAACGPGRSAQAPATAAPTPEICANVVRAPVLPEAMVQDLGTLAVGDTARFTVGAGVSGFVIVSQEDGASAPARVVAGTTPVPNAVVPTDLRAPSGALYYDDFAAWPTTTFSGAISYADTTGLLAFDAGFQPALGVFPFPATSGGLAVLRGAGAVEPGTWTFTVNDWAHRCPLPGCPGGAGGGRYRVTVVQRPGGIPASGTLDVEVYLATGPSSLLPTAAAAAASPQVTRWKRTLAGYLENAGITLGEVTFHDLPADVKARDAANGRVDVGSSDPCGPLSRLFTSAVAPRRAIHLFLADVLTAPAGGGAFQVIGVDGSIPGPSGFPGTIYGGAIVGLEDFGFEAAKGACAPSAPRSVAACGTDRTAYVTAHEIGHWLGLFHTTESGGTFFDPVADTDPCPCHACAAPAAQAACADVNPRGSAVVPNGRCVAGPACGGGRNLMFWLLGDQYSTGELTPDQAQIMRLNPAVR
jgi:hypothetical protein